ncbi:chromatin remodelling complex Rsc7/Swp82 subunit-domain-containing protein [Achaetomium macrosporum]|uniref:Chromatin remodelling complex Rsc7/Swp82 subunit-domain-containing protein n=1 Tax=Achaetomium macrosporum TaxID=79813 RepID=A0AAN7HJC5_9PEZI|nr:chromatin remodelling complex Rsc7/Swp82 subunit-domain-containing protein [Achaetomium macrosporum]
MYAAQPNGSDSATINPAALNTDLIEPASRGVKRSRSPDEFGDAGAPGPAGDDGGDKPRKRGRPMKSRTSGGAPESAPASLPPAPPTPQTIPPQTPQSQNAPLPSQTPTYAPPRTSPPKSTPTKSTLKALPTVRDHTTDQLGPGGDEYLPREIDEAGEKKVLPNGQLTGGREYRCRTFLVPNRGDKLFMLATECARVLGYRDSYLLFNKNRSLYKIIASQIEKDDLVQQEILPFSYRSRQIAIVTARSMFRQFGSRVIVNGRRVRDDYWETKARKQGFTEADPAGEKRPGASKAREAEASHNNAMLGAPHGEIVYSTNPGQFGGAPQPQLMQPGMIGGPPGSSTRMPVITLGPEYNDTRTRDYSSILKTGPRQEITGPPYQDRIQPTPISELHAQAHHAAEFNRSVNQQREMRSDYMQSIWRRPHDQPTTTTLSQPVSSADATVPTTRPAPVSHSSTSTTGLQQPGVVPHQSPMMITAAPYSQPIQAQHPLGQNTLRGIAHDPAQSTSRPTYPSSGSAATLPQATQNYSYSHQGQMWPPTPQTPQHGYSAYTTQSQPSPHPQQSPAPLRHSSSSGPVQPGGMSYSGMPGLGQGYGAAPTQGMYSADQTPRQYMHQSPQAPAVTQGWSQPQAPAQWWASQPQ